MSTDLKTRLLAFGYYTAREVVASDGVDHEQEKAFIERAFPRERLMEHGLVDLDGEPTPLLSEAYLEARGTLAMQASLEERLALLETLLQASVSDEHLDYEEGGVLFSAAEVLDVPAQTFLSHMDSMDEVGEIDLPEPEEEETQGS